ncbi:hypothetical protein BGX24_000367 [Mortierella sp. AD032]|nr:hypothetical protein BGX24_000367 [Mortierella sp. AD032]
MPSRIVDNGGLSSAKYWQWDYVKTKFSVTFYSGSNCDGRYDRWTFPRLASQAYNINAFHSLDNNVRSFKIADFETSTTSGDAGKHGELSHTPDCDFIGWDA